MHFVAAILCKSIRVIFFQFYVGGNVCQNANKMAQSQIDQEMVRENLVKF